MRDRRPIAIWDKKNADLWHSSTSDVQDAWDRYAQGEADKQDAENGSYYACALYHQWTPPLSFSEWLELEGITPTAGVALSSRTSAERSAMGVKDAEKIVARFERAHFNRCLVETGKSAKEYKEARAALIAALSSVKEPDNG